MSKKTMTADEYRAAVSGQRKNKYHAEPVMVDGIRFDSKAEARRYGVLKLLKDSGSILGFGLQPSFELVMGSGVRYRPDFIVCAQNTLHGQTVKTYWVEDVKGMETREFKRTRKLWEQMYPWLELRVVKY